MSSPRPSSAQRRGRPGRRGELAHIFVKDGEPVAFYLMHRSDHRDISEHLVPLSEKRVETLTRRIEEHGGVVCDAMNEAQVIIVNEEAVDRYRLFYRFQPGVDIEPPGFVSRCIRDKEYRHWRPVRMAMGGKTHEPARPRMQRRGFTKEEDRFLAEYIALRIPENAAGGRMGNKIYQELVEQAQFGVGRYAMARNHTWHSWRERYKKQPEYFNEMIEKILLENGTHEDDKAVYPLDRRLSRAAGSSLAQESIDDPADESVMGADEDKYLPHGQKRRAGDSDASQKRSSKRLRPDLSSDSSLEEFSGFEDGGGEESVTLHHEPSNGRDSVENGRAGPSGTRHFPATSPSSQLLHSEPSEPGPSTAPKVNRPKPRPVKSIQRTSPFNSQKTLVNSTQHITKEKPSEGWRLELEEPDEDRAAPEPRQPRPRTHEGALYDDIFTPNISSASRVGVVVPRIQDIRIPAQQQAKRSSRASLPPIATLSHSAKDNNDASDEHSDLDNEVDELDDSRVVDNDQLGEPDDLRDEDGDGELDAVNEKARRKLPAVLGDIDEGEGKQDIESEGSNVGVGDDKDKEDEDEEEEDEEMNRIFDASSEDEEHEVHYLVSPLKSRDDHSESDFKAQRSLMNLDQAAAGRFLSSPVLPTPPRRSTARMIVGRR